MKRLCADCGIREVEKRHIYCSECGLIRRQFLMEINRYNWIKKNPIKYQQCYIKNNRKHKMKQAKTNG